MYGADGLNADGAFHLLLKLEDLDVFSFQNPSGLIQVAQDISCVDLVKRVKTSRKHILTVSSYMNTFLQIHTINDGGNHQHMYVPLNFCSSPCQVYVLCNYTV